MPYINRIFIFCIILVIITGCSLQIPSAASNKDIVIHTTTPGADLNPIEQITQQKINGAYPGPLGAGGNTENNSTTGNPVAPLPIPIPSNGKAVVFGEVKISSDSGGLNISNLFLSPLASSDASDDLSSVTFSEGSDPTAILDTGSGQFVFTDVIPGQYALMIWTTMRAYPLGDNLGKTIVFTVSPGESKDLGVISVH
jgi:hypothetical protein